MSLDESEEKEKKIYIGNHFLSITTNPTYLYEIRALILGGLLVSRLERKFQCLQFVGQLRN
jgi:hypothetical protein